MLSFGRQYGDVIIGVDEAGRGAWAGPVVAASVIIESTSLDSKILSTINDSKKLSTKKREMLYDCIISSCKFGVGIVDSSEIDVTNILKATKKAMSISIDDLFEKHDSTSPDIVLIDGNQIPESINYEAISVVKGDSKYISIAAASIVAKVTRDNIIRELHLEHPYYGWDSNAAYGTKKHLDGMSKHGITKYHRQSYAPIKRIINA